MNWVDIVIAIALAGSLFAGIQQGLIRSVLSLVGMILGIVLASNFYQQLADILAFISNKDIANIVAFLIILVAVMVVAAIVAAILKTVIKAVMLGWVDRVGGAVFGLLMGAFSVSALLAIIVKFTGTTIITDSVLARFFLEKFPIVLGFLPSEFDIIRDFFK